MRSRRVTGEGNMGVRAKAWSRNGVGAGKTLFDNCNRVCTGALAPICCPVRATEGMCGLCGSEGSGGRLRFRLR